MPRITYVLLDGSPRVIEVPAGQSVMEGAVTNGLEGIVADCGGNMACATCHVYVDPAWMGKLPAPDESETAMLEFAAEPRPTSRLSCQIRVGAEIDGLVVHMPESQG
jgi:2Fe-2S ferredoxin